MTSREDIERTTIDILGARDAHSSICPSEVARELNSEHWRELMDPVREVAASLATAGTIEVTQGGTVVDIATARGPVRLRRGSAWAGSSERPDPDPAS